MELLQNIADYVVAAIRLYIRPGIKVGRLQVRLKPKRRKSRDLSDYRLDIGRFARETKGSLPPNPQPPESARRETLPQFTLRPATLHPLALLPPSLWPASHKEGGGA